MRNLGNAKILASVMTIVLLTAINAFGGTGLKNYNPQSGMAWLLCGARMAETDDADVVLNNPAGAPFMKDGWYTSFSAFYATNDFKLTNIETEEIQSVDVDAVIPFFSLTYKKDNWATYFMFFLPGGNGSGNFSKHPMTDIFGSIFYPGTTATNYEFVGGGGKAAVAIGGSYAFNDHISVSYSPRLIYGFFFIETEQKFVDAAGQQVGSLDIDAYRDGWGLGHSFGLLYKFNDRFKIGLRYDLEASVETTFDTKKDDTGQFPDGSKVQDDLPAMLCTGIQIVPWDRLIIDLGFDYIWQKNINGDEEWPIPISDRYENAFTFQIGLRYRLTPKWELGGGVFYNDFGMRDKAYHIMETPHGPLAWAFMGGVIYSPTPKWDLMLGVGKQFFPDEPVTRAEQDSATGGLWRMDYEGGTVAVMQVDYKVFK